MERTGVLGREDGVTTIYLAGFISTDHPETFAWREEAERSLQGRALKNRFTHLDVLNPCRSKGELRAFSKDGGVTSENLTPRDIILRDYHDVTHSNVILVNLDNYGSTRPLVGTICELAWAWEERIPVVAFCSPDNYLMRNHPFIQEFVSHYFDTLEDAVEFIVHYYI